MYRLVLGEGAERSSSFPQHQPYIRNYRPVHDQLQDRLALGACGRVRARARGFACLVGLEHEGVHVRLAHSLTFDRDAE